MTDFQTKILICRACGAEFVFTADAQRYFSDQRINKDPKLCKLCYSDMRKILKLHSSKKGDERKVAVAAPAYE